jgi:imidazoleglycerol-phosphate dehydratase/histidinol-phosphatase
MFEYMGKIAKEMDFELAMVTNQDGLGTEVFPENTFYPVHDFIMQSLENEGIHFDKTFIDRTFPSDNKPTRKPGTGMLVEYLDNEKYDIKNSYVIGDRITDVLLAKNLGCKAIWINNHNDLGATEINESAEELREVIALETTDWKSIYEFLKLPLRKLRHERNTNETKISIALNLDGKGTADIHTGLAFFDHMLEQIARHGNIDLAIECKGDLHIDEHHTIE